MDKKEFINNKLILCTTDNKVELSEFLNSFNPLTPFIKAHAFVEGYYYGFEAEQFGSFAPTYAFQLAERENVILYNLESIKFEYTKNIFRVPRQPIIEHPLNNILIKSKDKALLCSFFSKHSIVLNMKDGHGSITPTDLHQDYYYGLRDGSFVEVHPNRATLDKSNVLYVDLKDAVIPENIASYQRVLKKRQEYLDSVKESGDITEEADNIISIHTPERTFPRLMWVKEKDYNVDFYVQRIVVNKLIDKYVAVNDFETFKEFHVSTDNKYQFQTWDEAIELDDLTVLTREDIAKLANTTVDKLKIIE